MGNVFVASYHPQNGGPGSIHIVVKAAREKFCSVCDYDFPIPEENILMIEDEEANKIYMCKKCLSVANKMMRVSE